MQTWCQTFRRRGEDALLKFTAMRPSSTTSRTGKSSTARLEVCLGQLSCEDATNILPASLQPPLPPLPPPTRPPASLSGDDGDDGVGNEDDLSSTTFLRPCYTISATTGLQSTASPAAGPVELNKTNAAKTTTTTTWSRQRRNTTMTLASITKTKTTTTIATEENHSNRCY